MSSTVADDFRSELDKATPLPGEGGGVELWPRTFIFENREEARRVG